MLRRFPVSAAGVTLALMISGALAQTTQQPPFQDLPNMGQHITPLAPTGAVFQTLNPGLKDAPDWVASHAVSSVVSPDHTTLLVMTSGYNRIFTSPLPPVLPLLGAFNRTADSAERVFIYDVTATTPVLKQALPFANTYSGIVFDPSGLAFYVAGGPSDNVHIIALNTTTGLWGEAVNSPLPLGHGPLGGLGLSATGGVPMPINEQVAVTPCAAGVAISSDGKTLVVANYGNDSITVFNRGGGFSNWSAGTELDLRPGKIDPSQAGVPGGEYPYWVAVKGIGPSATAYVSSIRDREIVVVNLGRIPTVATRIKVKGQPNKMTLNAAQSLLYVADDQADTVDVIDTTKNSVLESIPVISSLLPAALAKYKGANPNSVSLSPDETKLYVTNGNLNCVAVISLGGTNNNDKVVGLIPTGWYPNSVSLNWYPKTATIDGTESVNMYVVNGKGPTGPNSDFCYGGYGPGPPARNCVTTNQYNPQRTKAGLQSFPLPDATQLAARTAEVMANNRFMTTETPSEAAVMAAVRQGVKHVIFILKENRTFDQILGDLKNGADANPALTEFGAAITPNEHNLAQKFVTLDHFLDTAEVSVDGWLWSTSAQAPDMVQKQWPLVYGYRGLSVESEGLNRDVNVSIPTVAGRQIANPLTPGDPDLLPGQTDTDAPDGPNNEINTGFLWDNALRANLTVRNYGFFIDGTRYNTSSSAIPVERNPFETGTVVAYPTNIALTPFTDPYFRGFDNALPDFYRYSEWAREFDANYANNGTLPSLSLVRFMHDHTGNFVAGPGGYPPAVIDGVNTPELMVADNDYAVGLLIQKIANSMYANDTLIFVVEDDAQDGGDHVDSHRCPAFVAGAFVKQGVVVSTPYNTVNFLRTIEEVLGLPPMNLNDALAHPMADIFNTTPSPWSFVASPSAFLYNTQLLLPPKAAGLVVPKPTHNARYWARVTKGLDFSDADLVDPGAFNRILWKGMMRNKPYPVSPDLALAPRQTPAKRAKADKD